MIKEGLPPSVIANPPKSDDRYAQLTRGAFIINDYLQNPHFNTLTLSKNDSLCFGQNIFL